MDVPAANQSHTPSQPWAGQNGWSPASPLGPPCDPLAGFQQLSLSSPSDQRPRLDHQGGDLATCPPSGDTRFTLHPIDADRRARGPAEPPRSLPLAAEGLQPMPFYSPHSPHPGTAPLFQPPYTHQGPPDGPRRPYQTHLPISSPSLGAPESSGGFTHRLAPPTSPVSQRTNSGGRSGLGLFSKSTLTF